MSRLLATISLLLAVLFSAAAQQEKEPQDSLVRLVGAQRGEVLTKYGVSYRKLTGNVRFLHNNTYLLCDSALWNVNDGIIDAMGNVSIIQQDTELKSDKLTYLVNDDLAQFRGSVVQLRDKENNTLRTRFLDYNTSDSVAVFQNGGSMKDKDGQVIESRTGTYDSKIKTFDFVEDVNMYTDSVFVKTTRLTYQSEINRATFGHHTDAWKDDKMLSSDDGWYDRENEIFFFRDNVHVLSEEQEGWADTLYFYKMTSDLDMYGNVQLKDTVKAVNALAGHLWYVDSISTLTMTREPVVIMEMEEEGKERDTVYVGADTMVYYAMMRFEVPDSVAGAAEQRLKDLEVDPVGEYRKRAAEEARKAKEAAALEDPNNPDNPNNPRNRKNASPVPEGKPLPDNLDTDGPPDPDDIPQDTIVTPVGLDSLAVADTLVVPDSTRIGFAVATGRVKIFRKDMQVVCDSLLYCDLDSLARLFKEPSIWQEVRQQFTADSISVRIRNKAMDKASLMSNAFIHIQEDSLYYDQIKSTEMMAFFREDGALYRFDALGGAQAVFFLEENETIATVNKKDCKMLSANFEDGNLSKVYYYETAKSDAYPVVQLDEMDKKLKGFAWTPERRPDSPAAVTSLIPRNSERGSYAMRPRTSFTHTDTYFPGYMKEVYYMLDHRDSIYAARQEQKAREKRIQDSLDAITLAEEQLRALDSLSLADSLSFADSLGAGLDSLALADSLGAGAGMDGSDLSDSPENDSESPSAGGKPGKGAQPEKSLAEEGERVLQQSPDAVEEVSSGPGGAVDQPGDTAAADTISPEELRKQQERQQKEAEKRKKAYEQSQLKLRKSEAAAAKQAFADSVRNAKQALKEAEWAKRDAKDAEKAAARKAKAGQKELKHLLKARKAALERAAKEEAMIERYRQNLLKKNRTIKPKPGELDALMDEYMPGERQKRQQASEEVKLKGDSEVKD